MKIQHFTFNPFQENTYIVYNEEKEAIIIDPGCYSEKEESILNEFIVSNNLKVKLLVNTHLHIDHCFGNAFVERTYHVKAFANREDEFLLKDMAGQAKMFGIPLRHAASSLENYIHENDKFILGSEIFEAFQIPGHSPGSVVLYNAKSGCVFVGDVLFQGSIGRSDLQKGNYQSLIEGIREKLLTLPDETVVYCGHGPTTTIGHEKANNPFI
ncbi:MAG: MBL fold metallo-hydrolase [Bacteroidales bacterium]|nr:MBL fold metallo-hydrolase [Bacteroidales bacterium]